MTLGERIRDRRRNAGLSQEKVAEFLGISRQAVAKWEANQASPNTQHLFKLAEILGTTVEELMTAGETPQQMPVSQNTDRRKKNVQMALAIVTGYLFVYLTGRILCGNLAESSLWGWLTGTDSKSYLFGWLTHQGIFWVAMGISAAPALWGWRRFSVITFAAFVLGILLGELFGPYPAGVAQGHGHYGWAIWGSIFLLSMAAGAVDARIHRNK